MTLLMLINVFQSLRDIDYIIKDKTFLESVMDTEFYDATETGIFYNGKLVSFEPRREKTRFLHMRKQRRRSASR